MPFPEVHRSQEFRVRGDEMPFSHFDMYEQAQEHSVKQSYAQMGAESNGRDQCLNEQ